MGYLGPTGEANDDYNIDVITTYYSGGHGFVNAHQAATLSYGKNTPQNFGDYKHAGNIDKFGIQAVAFQNNIGTIVAIAGTNEARDLISDAKMAPWGRGLASTAEEKAIQGFISQFDNVTVVCHSYGGALAQLAATMQNVTSVVAFNAPGPLKGSYKEFDYIYNEKVTLVFSSEWGIFAAIHQAGKHIVGHITFIPSSKYHSLVELLENLTAGQIRDVRNIDAAIKECFPASTPILLPNGSSAPIESLAIGVTVLAFATGTTSLTPARVTRLFHNLTEEWIELVWLDPATGETRSLTATPGHVMATPEGGWKQLGQMIVPPFVREADFGVEPLVSPRPSGPASRGEREEALTKGQEFGALKSEWQLAA